MKIFLTIFSILLVSCSNADQGQETLADSRSHTVDLREWVWGDLDGHFERQVTTDADKALIADIIAAYTESVRDDRYAGLTFSKAIVHPESQKEYFVFYVDGVSDTLAIFEISESRNVVDNFHLSGFKMPPSEN